MFEQAAGGVLFVNGIEDLPPKAQGLLVAALETKSITRVGSATPTKTQRAHHRLGVVAFAHDADNGSERRGSSCCRV